MQTVSLKPLAEQCIPTKYVTIRPRDLPLINNTIRRLIRKRNRLYKKYKQDRTIPNYDKFKQARNEVTSNLRKAKKDYTDSLANKLKTSSLSSRDYWKTLKSFIKPSNSVTIPPLLHENTYVADSDEKAILLNSYFVERWLVKFNAAKFESLLVSRNILKPFHPPLLMNNEPIKEVSSHKHLGLFLSNDGKWHEHIIIQLKKHG